MKIDRTKFLVLTGTLSAATAIGFGALSGGCSSTPTDTDAGSTTSDSGVDEEDASTADSGGDDTDAGTDAGDGGGDASDGGACLGDTATTTSDCSTFTKPGCQSACSYVNATFRAGVAEDINACVLKLPTCEGGVDVDDCIKAAIPKACEDPASATTCTKMVNNCAESGDTNFTEERCEKLFSALSTTGRDDFTSCVTEGIADGCSSLPSQCLGPAAEL